MNRIFLILLFFTGLFIMGCGKLNVLNKSSDQYFPLMIGDTWTYNVSDTSYLLTSPNVANNYDVKITVTGTKKLDDVKDAFVLKYEYPKRTDTLYLQVASDTINCINPKPFDYLGPSSNTFIVPFSDNQTYSSTANNYPFNYEVKNLQSYNSPYMHLETLFIINRSAGIPLFSSPQYYIFKSGIGFVEFTCNMRGIDTYSAQTWRLKSYDLK